MFIPLILEGMPNKVGYLQGSPGSSCVEGQPCVIIKLGRVEITTSSFAYLIIALSVFLQSLVYISVGAMADYGRNRKKLLIAATLIGSTAAILMLTVVGPSLYWYASILSLVIKVAYGPAVVFYNAYLPLIAKNCRLFDHQQDMEQKGISNENLTSEPEKSLSSSASAESGSIEGSQLRRRDNISSFISTRGLILGYLAAFVVMSLSAVYIYLGEQTFFNLEVCIAFCGLWWLVFSVFPFLKLKTRPGPELPTGTNYIAFSWRKVGNTLKKCRRLPITFWYLLCFFLFSDGYSTLGAVAVIFARTEMNIPYDKVIIAVLISPFSSVLGNVFFYLLQKWTQMSSKSVLVLILSVMGLIPTWGIMGLFTDKVGLRNQWELYFFASVFGFLVGALQSYSRVIFSELIPPGDESEFFSLYAVMDGCLLGPICQSLLLNVTGSSRFGLIVLVGMIWIPIPIILFIVDMRRGSRDAKTFHDDPIEQQDQNL